MNSFLVTLAGLFGVYAALISTGKIAMTVFICSRLYPLVYCAEIKKDGLSKDELIALTRDHFGREDPDALLNGFFPVWAVIQLLIAGK
jgi:hypothetical protein